MPEPDHTETIATEILSDLSLREEHIIAHMNEMDVEILEATLERYVEGKGSRLYDGKDVIRGIWAKLYASHGMRVVE